MTALALDFQWSQVLHLNQTGKANRMRKLQEEFGEMTAELGLFKPDPSNTGDALAEEAVDVALMLISILADSDPTDNTKTLNELFISGIGLLSVGTKSNAVEHITALTLRLATLIGHIAEADQKIEGVSSSLYKCVEFNLGEVIADRLSTLRRAVAIALIISHSTVPSVENVQWLIAKKMDKWERVSIPT